MNRNEIEENNKPNGKDIKSSNSINEFRTVGCCHCKTNHVEKNDNIFEADLKAFELEVSQVFIEQYLPCLETPTVIDGMSCRPRYRMGIHPSNSLTKLIMTSRHHHNVKDQNGCNNDSTGIIKRSKHIKRCSHCRMKRLQRILDEAIAITTEVHQIIMSTEEDLEPMHRI